jgi:hypothetical protein
MKPVAPIEIDSLILYVQCFPNSGEVIRRFLEMMEQMENEPGSWELWEPLFRVSPPDVVENFKVKWKERNL